MNSNESYQLSRRDCELLRITASIMVVVVHCVHVWVQSFYDTRAVFSLGFTATFIDQFTRFTVPLFFFLSGFGLTCQFLQGPPTLAHYYRFRPIKILIPFFVWSAITSCRHSDIIFHTTPWQTAPLSTTLHFLKFLFADGFDYQYYFLIVIFQFYLLFPFIYRLLRNPWVLGGFFLLQMAFMSPIEAYLELMGWQLPALHSSLLLFYVFYCTAGIYAAWHRDFLVKILRNFSGLQILVFWTGALGLVFAEYWINIDSGKNLWDTDHFNRWSIAVYCLASLLLFMKNKDRLHAFLTRGRYWEFLYTGVAPFTFFVYLCHTHVLRLFDVLGIQTTLLHFIVRILGVVAGTYAVAWLAQWLLADYPRLRFALGLPKERLRWIDLPGFTFLKSRTGGSAHVSSVD